MTMILGCMLLVGCSSNESNAVADIFINMQTLISEVDKITNRIDQVIEEDLALSAPVEEHYSTEQTYASLTKYIEANKDYMTEEITKDYQGKVENIKIYEHLIDYDQRILRSDLVNIKTKLHAAFLEKEKEYKDQLENLTTLKKEILQEGETQKKLIEENKNRRSNVLHLVHNYKKDDQQEKKEIISIKLESMNQSLQTYKETEGSLSQFVDQKRSLVATYDYASLKGVYESILEVMKKRSGALQKMNDDLQYLENSLQ